MQVSIKDIEAAAKDLSNSALKLYLYFASNCDGYNFLYSPQDFKNHYGVSESTAKRAKAELIDKGYIIQNDDSKHFDFYASKQIELSQNELTKEINILFKKVIQVGTEKEIISFKEMADEIKQEKDEEKKLILTRQLYIALKESLTKTQIDLL